MKKFLNKLINLAELAIGAFLFLVGITGTFSYFIFNALLAIMGFVVFADALSKIDSPESRNNNDESRNNDADNNKQQ